ncbi:hypothetical protein [Pseudofulvimonas gallinarii]|uniref:Tetratricopeptide repeat protein n=2 Tax=Pseudofulvimonas gallinarii TaxID=634155 RepID=A0A4S3KVW1_9GAMM|nr:hypothetical protein [Pseudofulvimonas gallinarii]TCS97764.1 hypothetical protein EDC25_11144 [Pseudofulvimonas gallinarii]THD13392.1 hypothetical protein B1808_08410 [Pseudofulvimonas gallinarii]
MSMNGRDRPEPGLGQIDDIDPDAPRPHVDAPERTRRPAGNPRSGPSWPLVALLLVAVAGAAFYGFGDGLRGHFSGSETRDLLNAAARAEAEGRWHGGDGAALALYRQVQGVDPDNDVARLGLQRVIGQLRRDADAALDAGENDKAEALIQVLAGLGEAGEHVAGLRKRLDAMKLSGRELSDLLARAEAALARRRIRGDNGALVAYKRMLALDPGNAVARAGVEQSLQVLADEAGKEIVAGNLSSADDMIQSLAAEQPLHAALPALRQARAEAASRRDETSAQQAADAAAARARADLDLATQLENADQALRERRLEAAVAGYRRVLDARPDHPDAIDGLDLASRAALERARAALSDSNVEAARAALDLAVRAEADPQMLERLQRQLAATEERLTAVLARPDLDPAQKRQLEDIMARARAAESRGELVEPAGESAYDLYRHALSIDPMFDPARQAAAALPRRAQTLVVHHVELGQLDQAGHALDALQAMAPMQPGLSELRRMVAGAWLERGADALREGAVADARAALEKARAVMPEHPGVQQLAVRIQPSS